MAYRPITAPTVTAVIPVYNEEDCIADCIESLRGQDFRDIQIIAVDDGSGDSSAEICRKLGVRVLFQDHRGPGAARNLGVGEASGSIIIFADADMTFGPGYVSAMIAPIISGSAAGTSHKEEVVSNWDNAWARLQTWYLGFPDRKRIDPSRETSVYRAVRRDFFLSNGGFADNEGRGDDGSLAGRSGIMPAMVAAECYHKNIDGPLDGFYDARWRGRDMGSKIDGFLSFLKIASVDRNPVRDLVFGLRLFWLKGDFRAVPYAVIFGFGFQCGLFSAFFRKNYLK